MSYPNIIVDSGGGEKIKVYEGDTQVGTLARKLNFNATDFNVTEDTGNDRFDITLSNAGKVLILDREVTQQAVNTTTVETTVFSDTIDASVLSTNKWLRLTMMFDLLMNSGTPILTIRVKFGGTTLWAASTAAYTASANRRPGMLVAYIFNQNSASVQVLGGNIEINSSTTASVTSGVGSITDGTIEIEGPLSGSAAEDTTASKILSVTVQMDVSNVAVEFRKQGAVLELL